MRGAVFLSLVLTKWPPWKQEVAANGPVGLPECLRRCVCSGLQGAVTWFRRFLK